MKSSDCGVDGVCAETPNDIIRDNSWRLAGFRTQTVIRVSNGQRFVCKYALTKEAQPFLKVITERERANIDYLSGHFSVLCGVLKGDHIEYQYCPHRSLQAVIGDFLDRGDYRAADRLVQEYVRKLHSLEMTRVFPEEFISFVGDPDKNRFVVDAFTHGVLDLTPRNILLNGNTWIVLDNEWSFDFPIPVAFVLFRALTELVNKLQRQVRLNANEGNPVKGLLTRRFRNLYFPKAWVDYLSSPCISLERLIAWEQGFQKYVTGTYGGVVYRVRKNCTTQTGFFTLRFYHYLLYCFGKFLRSLKRLEVFSGAVRFFKQWLAAMRR